MGIFGKNEEQKAKDEIKSIRKEIKDITDLGEGAVEIKKKELEKKRKRIETIKSKYPKDKGVQEAKLNKKKNPNKYSNDVKIITQV